MSDALVARVGATLATPVADAVATFARRLADGGAVRAVLFYGSNLRTGSLDGVLDFYLLTGGPVERGIWPTVGYREETIGGATLRAKTATMTLATFARAAQDRTIDTTIWTRFVQPCAIAWARDAAGRDAAMAAVAAATVTAARYAAALGPEAGGEADYWRALFRATYAAELRVEARGREGQILDYGARHFEGLLPLAWAAGGIAAEMAGGTLRPALTPERRAAIRRRWRRRRRLGRPLNVARLVRAAFTFDGAARYAAWKIERHTGVPVPLTPWRERHPILAAPGVLFRLWRARRAVTPR